MNTEQSRQEKEERYGIVINALPNATFKVVLNPDHALATSDSFDSANALEVFAYLSGKMRLHRIKVLVGDKVRLEMDPYDKTKGKIVQRL